MKKLVSLVAAFLCAAALVGCEGEPSSPSKPQGGSSAKETPSESPGKAQGSPTEAEDKTAATLVKSGFGQDGQFVWVTSLVHNDSEAVGQTVTVHFDLRDAKGKRLKSVDQTGSFTRVGEELAVGTQLSVPLRSEVATVKASLEVENKGAAPATPFPELPVSGMKVVKTDYGSWTMRFKVANPTTRPVQSPKINVICYNDRGKIIGGASAYPAVLRPNGKTTAVEPAGAIVSGKPAKCEAYVSPM